MASPSAAEDLRKQLVQQCIGGIVNLLPMESRYADESRATELVTTVFNFVQVFEDDLRKSATRGGGWLFNITAIDGTFGLTTNQPTSITSASTIGMFKSIGREWPEIRLKVIDLDPQAQPDALLFGLGEELACDCSDVEVCLSAKSRRRITLRSESVSTQKSALNLDRDSVILITGGAFGVTADSAKRLAHEYQSKLVLLGRSDISESESHETRELSTEAQLRGFFVRQVRAGRMSALPSQIERTVQKHLKDRVIRSNIKQMQESGSRVDYRCVDVRNEEALGGFIDSVYQQYGRLDGVIHGAGVVEDSLIRNKTLDSFRRVFETKVLSANVLAQKLDPRTLQFLVFFSSVSGRFGNAGQVDYAAANEYLNKLAAKLDQQWPARVVSINWGPWNSGMVSDGIRKIFNGRGIEFIDCDQGTKALLDELRTTRSRVPEVVLARTIDAIANADQKRQEVYYS